MLKQRIIGVVLVDCNGVAIQSIGFSRFLPIGSPEIAVEFLNRWGIDEVVLLHKDMSKNRNFEQALDIVKVCSRYSRVPLAVGGGIQSLNDAKGLFEHGADKVIINSAAFDSPELIEKIAHAFGSQATVVSIDVYKSESCFYAYRHLNKQFTKITLKEQIQKSLNYGAGEIFVNSVNCDGMKCGYDQDLLKLLASLQSGTAPIVICGGVGHPQHLDDALKFELSGLAAGNFWHFSEQSVATVKNYLENKNANIRENSYLSYKPFNYDDQGRIKVLPEDYYEDLRFVYVAEEKI